MRRNYLIAALPLLSALSLSSTAAQTIVPAADGTDTDVKSVGNRVDIRGGKTSVDGANLFHSFTEFGLDSGQIANFISNDAIANILGRVTGGNPSLINGLIQVTSGNSNLFLLNPAGIVFGSTAQLNLPGDFTATTATGMGFGDRLWFNAIGSNDYTNLVGTPSTFAFDSQQVGSLLNSANLSVSTGQDLTLLGGTVVSTGTLAAPQGNITVAAVPGKNLVRISQPGQLLSLDVTPIPANTADAVNATPPSLAQLIAGGNATNATGLSVNANGEVELTGSNIPIKNQDVVVQRLRGGAIALLADGNLTTGNLSTRSNSQDGGTISLTSRNGAITTGNLDSSSIFGNGGEITVIALNSITTSGINSSSLFGNGGNVTLDPIGDVQVGFINAQGGITGFGGNVNVTAGQFFRATSTFNGFDSISTIGGLGGGSVTFQHGGGPRQVPFTVGADYNGLNGTTGAIATGISNILSSGVFPDAIAQGTPPNNIQIITPPSDPQIPEETPPPQLPINDDQSLELDTEVEELEETFTTEFEAYLGEQNTSITTLAEAREILRQIERETGVKPALVYGVFAPASVPPDDPENPILTKQIRQIEPPDESEEQLEIVVVTAEGKPIRKRIQGATRSQIFKTATEFRSAVTNVRNTTGYLRPAQQLYQWLVAPLEAELQTRKIDNLAFLLEPGLRSIPLAALHDGEQFLVEKYSIGLMPSLSLTDTRYRNIQNSQVLAMGAEEFSDQQSLPAVPIELSVITEQLWPGQSFLNEAFTIENLKQARQRQPFGIVHFATHAQFQSGAPGNSYIQLWDRKVRLDQVRSLGLNDPPVELLTLSACRTALGDEEVELGFAGFAVQAGVKSVLASLWNISDEATLGLMAEFYEQLKTTPAKGEALRRAQRAVLNGEVRLENGQMLAGNRRIPLPPELSGLSDRTLTHPYYWSAFTVVGNPW
ncbi:MAG: CHAT domain-containing protein [Kastovskya adunca ATA6-11-RM4]|nr:CHAT domain-containing protein [Kastovskya adunca ATA6-11-RM4]